MTGIMDLRNYGRQADGQSKDSLANKILIISSLSIIKEYFSGKQERVYSFIGPSLLH